MNDHWKSPRTYQPGYFVNREHEIDVVRVKARTLKNNSYLVEQRVTIFTGQKGVGKSWLKQHLIEVCEESGLDCVSLDLRDVVDQDTSGAVTTILEMCNKQMNNGMPLNGITLTDKSRSFLTNTEQTLTLKPLVLLIDTVYESDRQLLAELEKYCLAPLARFPSMLILLFGRGQPYTWKEPELRLKAEFHELPLFDFTCTQQQVLRLHQQASLSAEKIFRLSCGNPLVNDCLLSLSPDPKHPTSDLVRTLEATILLLLQSIPGDKRERVREYMEALSVLRIFDELRIPTMLAGYYADDRYMNWSYKEAKQVRAELVNLSLADWDPHKGGYVSDATISTVLKGYLRIARPAQWQALHESAYHLYMKWAENYSRSANQWREEARYHWRELGRGEINV
jgi:hypothetical protein